MPTKSSWKWNCAFSVFVLGFLYNTRPFNKIPAEILDPKDFPPRCKLSFPLSSSFHCWLMRCLTMATNTLLASWYRKNNGPESHFWGAWCSLGVDLGQRWQFIKVMLDFKYLKKKKSLEQQQFTKLASFIRTENLAKHQGSKTHLGKIGKREMESSWLWVGKVMLQTHSEANRPGDRALSS